MASTMAPICPHAYSLYLPTSPMEPFRFLDLPAEIRTQIYEIILCTVEHEEPPSPDSADFFRAPCDITELRHNIEPQILRTCRFIYAEAIYVMRRKNLFVKLIVKIPFEEILRLLTAFRVPVLQISGKTLKRFKGFVMSHEITGTSAMQKKPRTLLLLHHDLDLFCKALAKGLWTYRHHKLVSHIVTLTNPYEAENLPNLPAFCSRKLQEKLIAPYRARLRGIPQFTIDGVIPEDLRIAAITKITRPLAEKDPESVIRKLERINSKGKEYSQNGDEIMAEYTWRKALLEVNRHMAGLAGQRLQTTGGINFLNQIAALIFDIDFNRAGLYFKLIHQIPMDTRLRWALLLTLLGTVCNARDINLRVPGATWMPSAQGIVALLYKEAVACRVAGEPAFIDRAEMSIEIAIEEMPGDPELKEESERIHEWRKQILMDNERREKGRTSKSIG